MSWLCTKCTGANLHCSGTDTHTYTYTYTIAHLTFLPVLACSARHRHTTQASLERTVERREGEHLAAFPVPRCQKEGIALRSAFADLDRESPLHRQHGTQ